jgi:hypothetical protein
MGTPADRPAFGLIDVTSDQINDANRFMLSLPLETEAITARTDSAAAPWMHGPPWLPHSFT